MSLTSYRPRLGNLPTVLDTIFAQTLPPDKVVLNLAFDEVLPVDVAEYIDEHNIEVYRVPDTKVYKKLIPTLKRYPYDAIISIDDDWLYPSGMIKDFVDTHKALPNNPISGNGDVVFETKCHCGCASLTKSVYWGEWLDLLDDAIIQHCPSDDMVYTYFSVKAGHPYVKTKGLYTTNMTSYNGEEAYSMEYPTGVLDTYKYLTSRFGALPNFIESYIGSGPLADQIYNLHKTIETDNGDDIRASMAFRIGKTITKPFQMVKTFFKQ